MLCHSSNTSHIHCGFESGSISTTDRDTLKLVTAYTKAHEFSVWCTYPLDSAVFLSGGDDGKLKQWDLREASQV